MISWMFTVQTTGHEVPLPCCGLERYHIGMAKEVKNETESTPKSSGGSIKVLLVDNDKDHARAMTESLERIGLDCTTATAGPDGAKQLADNIYDIVVTDLMMNDVDGMAILRQAKETQPECEVVMVTGHASVPLAVEAM